ncbi:Zn-dependent exopeptidase M28 [Thalassotalea insulae]|uniref:Zn-dependent exopeptidase M28 n=1 Tax=Thalassotalea insulae TaxID=2056778 RepID=A0ABQ6GVW4_9GAMM|nr:M20/M25/M40 family metallo-hydrolase [Thalassotalea insulae]GLX78782.1 Zn-dependent exopeptidase M28 [Thalassotalea insulae]
MIRLAIIFLALLSALAQAKTTSYHALANHYLKQLADQQSGIGARVAGTAKEQQTADFISKTLNNIGYLVTEQSFNFDNDKVSKNLIVNSNPKLKQTIILAAHYDSTGAKEGSLGATDNGAGVAAMLAIAKAIHDQPPQDYNIRFIAFGAEEQGLKGSNYYVQQLKNAADEIGQISAMINFDTIAGGDFVYVHSAHTKPYKCSDAQDSYNADTQIRAALLNASTKVLGSKKQYIIHPEYPGYPAGVTGAWSDHAPFACAGIPIAYVESTNFTINGKDGFDGYSQSTNPALWDCYNSKTQSACDRETESQWGKIWHTQYDNLDKLEQLFPSRVSQQVTDNVNVLIELLSHAATYFAARK